MTARFTLHGQRERISAIAAINSAPPLARVTVEEPKRSDPQNRALWAALTDIKRDQGEFFGPGLDLDDLKQVFMSALFKELRMARNVDGDGYVPLTRYSSKLSHAQMGELLTLIRAWGDQHEVQWTDPEKRAAA